MATLSHFQNALQVRGARQTNFADLHATVSRYVWSAEQAEAFAIYWAVSTCWPSCNQRDCPGRRRPERRRVRSWYRSHWEDERAELVAHARLAIQTGSVTSSGHPQAQPGHLADRLIRLDQRYRHLRAGGWRT
uniref:hypothetical protein n=1 Tax=Microcystis aeruginosa TaxID=1126 RepID=UPI001867FCA3|nr:hypothetical protein [Microcystis aeruginosa]